MGLYEYEAIVILEPGIDVNIFRNKIMDLDSIYYFKEWDDMGVKEMAYPIQGSWRGHYVRFVFVTLLNDVSYIENSLRMCNEILKFILVKCE